MQGTGRRRVGLLVLVAGSVLMMLGGTASAQPGRAPANSLATGTWFVQYYKNGVLVGVDDGYCPPAGQRWSLNVVETQKVTSDHYYANGGCRLTAFNGYGGTGTGVGLVRGGSGTSSFGAVAGNVRSIAQYG